MSDTDLQLFFILLEVSSFIDASEFPMKIVMVLTLILTMLSPFILIQLIILAIIKWRTR